MLHVEIFPKVRIRARNRRGWSPLSKLLEFETTFEGDFSSCELFYEDGISDYYYDMNYIKECCDVFFLINMPVID